MGANLSLNVHITISEIKLEIRVSKNLVKLKGKGRQIKNKQTTKQNKKKKQQQPKQERGSSAEFESTPQRTSRILF